MGIEPFLVLAILLAGIVLQIGLFAWRRLAARVHERIWMRERLAHLAGRLGLLCAGDAAWAGDVGGMRVRVETTALPLKLQNDLRKQTRVAIRRTLPVREFGVPQLLVTVRLPAPLDLDLELHGRRGPAGTVDLDDPIAARIVRACGDPTHVRRVLGVPSIREPLYELLVRYPASVVTSQAVYLWTAGEHLDPEAPVDLAREVALALSAWAELEASCDEVQATATRSRAVAAVSYTPV